MSEAWTPGPWFAEYDDNGFYYIHAKGAPSPYVVATGGEGVADKANITLAAAAPALAEALENMADLFIDLAGDPAEEDGWQTEEMRDAYFAAIAALKRARGQS